MQTDAAVGAVVNALMSGWNQDTAEELDGRLTQCLSIMSESVTFSLELGEYLPEMSRVVKSFNEEMLTRKLMAAMVLSGYTLDQIKASFA